MNRARRRIAYCLLIRLSVRPPVVFARHCWPIGLFIQLYCYAPGQEFHCSTTQLPVTCCKNFLWQITHRLQKNMHMYWVPGCDDGMTKLTTLNVQALHAAHAYANFIVVPVLSARGSSCNIWWFWYVKRPSSQPFLPCTVSRCNSLFFNGRIWYENCTFRLLYNFDLIYKDLYIDILHPTCLPFDIHKSSSWKQFGSIIIMLTTDRLQKLSSQHPFRRYESNVLSAQNMSPDCLIFFQACIHRNTLDKKCFYLLSIAFFLNEEKPFLPVFFIWIYREIWIFGAHHII